MILLIDNYDSFVYNLARYFERLGQPTRVVRNDQLSLTEIERLAPSAIVLSPGPCTPDEAGVSLEVVHRLAGKIPLLGVCLGHQTIGQAFGAEVVRAARPAHGRSSLIHHQQDGLFRSLPSPIRVGRYHSLVLRPDSIPADVRVTASSEDGCVMAIEHVRHPVFGLQFHPESILTEGGYELLSNFIATFASPRQLQTSELIGSARAQTRESEAEPDWSRYSPEASMASPESHIRPSGSSNSPVGQTAQPGPILPSSLGKAGEGKCH